MELDLSGVESLLRNICDKLGEIHGEIISNNRWTEEILERLYNIEESVKKDDYVSGGE